MNIKKYSLLLILSLCIFSLNAQNNTLNKQKIKEDLDEMITDISQNYIYLDQKNLDLDCIKETYTEKIDKLRSRDDVILMFEFLLDELYDNHISLNTNTSQSYRLSAPIHVSGIDGKYYIDNVWQTRIINLTTDIIGLEITHFNGVGLNAMIDQFPTTCHDKTSEDVREWIVNKVIYGKYDEPRMLTLRNNNGGTVIFNLDELQYNTTQGLLSYSKENEVGIIRLLNSLGNNFLIKEFDQALDSLKNTKSLIIDLRNTVSGGNSYVARGIMGRFIDRAMPYQKHEVRDENYNNQVDVGRSWVEYVSPRGDTYDKPIIILVGRWTGSMGEGLAIGMEATGRAKIVGSEMQRLAGAVFNFRLKHETFGYQLTMEKLYHINDTPREAYIPTYFVRQSTTTKDEVMEKAKQLLAQ